MATQIQIGIIGTSGYADIMHLTSLSTHPNARLAAICGRNRARAEELARKHEVAQVFTDYREMMEKGNLDAVIVASPDDLHYPMTMAALDAGLHVLCEKPLALTVEQAQTMAEHAEAAGVVNMVMFTFRWSPHMRYLQELVKAGYVGRCYHCDLRQISSHGRDGQYRWRFDAERAMGILGDSGSHVIDLAHALVGRISRVSATLATFIDRPEADDKPLVPANDSAMLLVEFENGAHGTISLSAVAQIGGPGIKQQIAIVGEAGMLDGEASFQGQRVQGARQGQNGVEDLPFPTHLWPEGDPTLSFFQRWFALYHSQPIGSRLFVDAILENRPVTPNFRDGLQTQKVIEAAMKSHQTGCWVAVD
jgi:predicted dehydrogenase